MRPHTFLLVKSYAAKAIEFHAARVLHGLFWEGGEVAFVDGVGDEGDGGAGVDDAEEVRVVSSG
jgi:hypothetical protein